MKGFLGTIRFNRHHHEFGHVFSVRYLRIRTPCFAEITLAAANRQGMRLSAQCLGLLVHRLARRAEVPLVSLHQFRHTCASDLLEGGAGLSELQGFLGHKRVDTTAGYLQIGDPERVKAISWHPLNEYLMAARKTGLQTMIGCMIGTSILISAAAQLAELCDYLDVDGNVLITNDPYTGISTGHGVLSFASAQEKFGLRATVRA
jgi:hypothetical protein